MAYFRFPSQALKGIVNIFIITYWHDPRFRKKAGGLIRMFSLADNLTKMGHNVTMILPKLGFPKQQTVARVIEIPFLDLPFLRPISFHFLSTLYLILGLKGVSLIYVRQMNSFLPLLIARLYRTPAVFEIPNDPFLAYESIGLIRRIFQTLTDKAAMALTNRIVVLSEWSKKRLSEIGGITPAKIIVTPSGTDSNQFRPLDKAQCCKEIGIDPSPFYVGFAGSFFDYEGVDVLIESAPFIIDKFPDTKFLLVGDGPMMAGWKAAVSLRGIQDSFIFTNRVPYTEVHKYICAMDICVAPHHRETNQASPVKIFDYMACGRPIVASNISVVNEIIGNSECALTVTPEDPSDLAQALIYLRGHQEKRDDMSTKGRKYVVSHYDRENIAKELLINLHQLL